MDKELTLVLALIFVISAVSSVGLSWRKWLIGENEVHFFAVFAACCFAGFLCYLAGKIGLEIAGHTSEIWFAVPTTLVALLACDDVLFTRLTRRNEERIHKD